MPVACAPSAGESCSQCSGGMPFGSEKVADLKMGAKGLGDKNKTIPNGGKMLHAFIYLIRANRRHRVEHLLLSCMPLGQTRNYFQPWLQIGGGWAHGGFGFSRSHCEKKTGCGHRRSQVLPQALSYLEEMLQPQRDIFQSQFQPSSNSYPVVSRLILLMQNHSFVVVVVFWTWVLSRNYLMCRKQP